jgi:hypothetical protein
MKKTLALVCASYFMVAVTSLSLSAKFNSKEVDNSSLALTVAQSEAVQMAESTYKVIPDKPLDDSDATETQNPPVLTATLAANENKKQVVINRGGDAIPKPKEQTAAAKDTKSTSAPKTAAAKPAVSKSKVETLSWSQAKSVFSIGSVVTVQDVYTGKTFRIKRTMGSNHADCEAVSKEDANIIKSIWGGFNWNIRPVILTVGNRRLAASMSSLPHAGVDSAPAFAVVDNRSEGYGRGENLDVVKDNGMNGHFDVHFLNSTRHKDGQVDPRHQAAIKVAGSK